MAFIQLTQSPLNILRIRLNEMFQAAKERRAQWVAFRVTFNELDALSERELNDLGISRSMITSIAMDAAYGTDR